MEWVKVTECLEINRDGEVRSISRKVNTVGNKLRSVNSKILTQRKGANGYMVLATKCHSESKTFLIHRLVATAFVPNPNSYPQINHKDGNKTNNHYSNLEWVTQSQNQRHAYTIGLQKIKYKMGKDVEKVIAMLTPHIPLSTHEIGDILGVSGTTIQNYIKRWGSARE